MKALVITRNKLEIIRAQLRRPVLTIGRSPTCDVILRAPGVEPIHFLIEWIGSGSFDPNMGAWSVVDISESTLGTTHESSEGQMLSQEAINVGGFNFETVEDNLAANEVIGGRIKESIAQSLEGEGDGVRGGILELVQVRSDSGAIEEVRHLRIASKPGREKLLKQVPEFTVEWDDSKGEMLLKVLLQEMPGAEIYNRGQKVTASGSCTLRADDVLQIRWQGREFFLRFVEKINTPPVPRDVVGDPLLRALLLGGFFIALLFFGIMHWVPSPVVEVPKEPPRVAKIEIPEVKKETPPPPPVAPPPKKEEEPPPEPEKKQPDKVKPQEKKPDEKKPTEKARPQPKKPPARAASPKFKSEDSAKPTSGLNVPAPVSNVNAVGLLGMLNKKSGPAGKTVQAANVINDGIVTESVSGAEDAKIVIRNPPSGVLGSDKSLKAGGTDGPGLTGASTTLRGAGKYDPSSVGAIARKGGTSGFGEGASLGGNLHGAATSSGAFLPVGDGEFSVDGGGLDRETVRRVIHSYQNQIRTCYEKSLLSRPNLSGRIVYKWTISGSGPVVSVEKIKSDVGADNLEACVQDVIKHMLFPRAGNGKPTRVIYPFVFQAKR